MEVSELLVQEPDGGSRRVPLTGARVSVGRESGNDLRYPEDMSLSRRHFVLERDGEEWYVVDLGSKNGTRVNGSAVTTRHVLEAGDRIAAGRVVIVFGPDSGRTSDSVLFVPSGTELNASVTSLTTLEKILRAERPKRVPQTSPTVVAGPDRVPLDHPGVQALIQAGLELVGHRPLPELFQRILKLAINAVSAERGVLMTLEGDTLKEQAVRGENIRISTTVRDQVVRQRESLLVPNTIDDADWSAQQSIHAQHIRCMMAVPFQTREQVIGLLYVDSTQSVREFDKHDLELLTVLANVAATRIEQERFRRVEEQGRLMERELKQAAEIQEGLLPERIPEPAGLDLARYSAACRTVGGDYHDFYTWDDGSVGVLVADVAGKGMPAALLMASLHASVHSLLPQKHDVDETMRLLNIAVSRGCPMNRFITMFLGVISPDQSRLIACNAGHNPPYLVRSDGTVETLESRGTVLGLLPESRYERETRPFERGDMLIVFSDGVTEAMNPEGELFDEERLLEVVQARRGESAGSILDATLGAVREWCRGAPASDDITLVVVRRT